MKWLITGGCGFIGVQLIAALRRQGGHQIRVLDNLSVGQVSDLETVAPVRVTSPTRVTGYEASEAVELVVGDIRQLADLEAAAQGADAIVHLAANTGVIPSIEDPLQDCEANVIGTVNALEAAKRAGVKGFVLASSGAPLGEQEPPIHEEKLPKPLSPYGASKLAGEAYCRVYHACYGIRTVALRFGNVYGPGSLHKGSVVAKFIRQVVAGETLTIYGDGKQTRDFIYIDDLVDAIQRGARFEGGGEVFQIATGEETAVEEIVDLMRASFAKRDLSLEVQYTEARVGEVIRNYSDVSKAAEMLGWRAANEPEAGIEKTIEWFLEQGQS